jgi:hypothetical protein
MKNWFRRDSEKKRKEQTDREDDTTRKQDNISSLYEIVEDHLKSLDYDQIRGISPDFAERFRAHQEIISEIIRTPPARLERHTIRGGPSGTDAGIEIIDARSHDTVGTRRAEALVPFSDEMILSHYDRMIRIQYDRLIDLTVDFLREVATAEIERVDSETRRIDSEVGRLAVALNDGMEGVRRDLGRLEERHLSLQRALEGSLIEQNKKIALVTARLWVLLGAVGIAAIIGGTALILSLMR